MPVKTAKRPKAARTIPDPLGFLLDSGLLYYINQRVAHPLGLSLITGHDAKTGRPALKVADHRQRPDVVLSPKEMALGERRLGEFMRAEGRSIMQHRKRLLGFVTQPVDE